jgi:hypothetical protein
LNSTLLPVTLEATVPSASTKHLASQHVIQPVDARQRSSLGTA